MVIGTLSFSSLLRDSSGLASRGSSLGSLSSGLLSLFLLLLEVVDVTVDEEINHDVPRLSTRDGATEAENLTGKEPISKSNRLITSVVDGDSNVHVSERSVSVSEGNDGDVHVRSLLNSLVISDGVSDNEETRLSETLLGLICESTRRITSREVRSTSEVSILEDSALTVAAGRDDDNILRVLDGSDGTSSQN